MKKIISLIILSLIFKGYVSAWTKGADNKCTGNEEGKTICVLEDEICVEKTLCSKVESPSAENCPNGVSLNQKKKCEFKSGTSCSETDKTCAEITEGASDDICLSVAGTGDNGCKYDSTNKKCIESPKCKTFTSVSDEKSCTNVPTSNTVTLKCVLKTNKCDEEAKKCSEIKFGGTADICSKAAISDDKNQCVAENGQCKEVAKEITESTTSSKNSTKSSTSTKSEEKNGANYTKLSLGLLVLLFF